MHSQEDELDKHSGACFPSTQNTSLEKGFIFILFFYFSIDFYKYR